MMLSRDAITSAVEARVEASDFYKPAHTHVYEAVMSLYSQGEPVDPITVAEELRRAELLDAMGGKAALLRIQALTPASANAAHYAKIVGELALLRRLISVAGDIAEMGYDLSRRRHRHPRPRRVARLRGRGTPRRRLDGRDLRRVAGDPRPARTALREQRRGHRVSRPATSTSTICCSGCSRRTSSCVAARPGAGKTAFALGAAANVAMAARRPVLFFSMEMGTLELTKRMLAGEARVDARKLQTGKIPESDWTRISHAVGRLAEAPLFIDDNPHCTVMEMRAKARRTKARHGDLALVVVDYLQLMTPSTARRSENRQVEVAEISRGSEDPGPRARVPGRRAVAAEPPARVPPGQAADARRPA